MANFNIFHKKAVEQPTKENIEANRRLEELNALRIDTQTEIPPVRASLTIDGIPIFEQEDLAAIKAKQKAGKTTVLKTMVAAWMKGRQFRLKSELEEPKVLWFDTEQKLSDVKQIIDDIKQMTGLDDQYIDSHLRIYTVRKLSYKTLPEDLELLVKAYHPQIVIIDGVVDFIESFNDETLSHQLINQLLVLSDVHHCAIISVLHENKSAEDHNMRGHLGTMLAQKAGTVLQCKKSSNGSILVLCSDSRHQAMPEWGIRYDEQGHIVDADARPSSSERQRKVETMKAILQEKGSMKRSDLMREMMLQLGMKCSPAYDFISNQLKEKTIILVLDMIQLNPEIPVAS